MSRNNGHRLPDEKACLDIMTRFQMPEHVVRHSQAVCNVALYLTRQLNRYGFTLNENLVRASALLHDITKRYSFNRPLDHALTGAKLIRHLGYPVVASIVRQHVRLSLDRSEGRVAEAELVFYADKRVINDRITTLDDRLAYIRDRYAKTPETAARINKYAGLTYQVEREIFERIPGGPEQVFDIASELAEME